MKFWQKITISLMVVLLSGSQVSLALAINEEELETLRNAPIEDCDKTLKPLFDKELLEFQKFLEANFQNKSSTTSLTNIAISRYREYKLALKQIFGNLRAGTVTVEDLFDEDREHVYESGTYLGEITGYGQCDDILTFYTDSAKEQMVQHIRSTAAVKKTTIMLEKFKAINSQLSQLNLDISQMFGLFKALELRLPGFVSSCVKR